VTSGFRIFVPIGRQHFAGWNKIYFLNLKLITKDVIAMVYCNIFVMSIDIPANLRPILQKFLFVPLSTP